MLDSVRSPQTSRCGHWGTERLNNLSKVTQRVALGLGRDSSGLAPESLLFFFFFFKMIFANVIGEKLSLSFHFGIKKGKGCKDIA